MLGLFSLAGCIKDISGEIPESEPKIAVNCFFNPRLPIFAISISQSASVLDSLSYLKEAKGYLYENDVLVDSVIYYEGLAQYHLALNSGHPQPGNTYRVQVQAPGFTAVTAQSFLPDSVPLLSIEKDTFFYAPTGHHTYWLRIHFQDPPAGGDFYHLVVYRMRLNPDGSKDLSPVCFESEDPAFEVISKEYCTGGMFTDNTFNGQPKELLVNTRRRINSNLNDSLQFIVELRHGSDPYYRYNKSFMDYTNNQGDIFAQPAPIIGNVTGGYGIFAGYAVCTDTVKLN